MSAPDDVVLPGVGEGIATDKAGGTDHHQLIKIEFGVSGAATMVSAADPLPVALPPDAATETTLAALSAKSKVVDLDTADGTDDATLVAIGLPASGGGVVGGTAANPIRTDPTGTTTQPVSGSVSATVSGAVTVSGTVTADTELPAAAALADASANPTAPAVGSHLCAYNGATWDRLRSSTASGLVVDVSRVQGTVASTQSGTWTVLPGNTANTTPWLFQIGNGTVSAAIKAASTAAVATDPALVVALSPNNNTLANALNVKITNGTIAATVKAASTAAVAADPSIVVSVSPNNTVAVTGTFWQATQPVSVATAVTVNPGNTANTTPWRVRPSDGTSDVAIMAPNAFPASADPAMVVTLSPNNNGVKLWDGTAGVAVRQNAAPSTSDGALVVALTPWSSTQIGTVGGTVASVKAASTPVTAADPVLAVATRLPAAATRSSVTASITVVTVLAANAARIGATIFNDSTAVLYLALGNTATATNFTIAMAAGSYYEVPFGYTGIITGIWVAVAGAARVTEMT